MKYEGEMRLGKKEASDDLELYVQYFSHWPLKALSTWNVVSVTEELNLKFYLI